MSVDFALSIAVPIAWMIVLVFYLDRRPSWVADGRRLWRRMQAINRWLFPPERSSVQR